MNSQFVIKRLIVGQLQTNCYVLADRNSSEAVIIDPGDDAEYIETILRDLAVTPTQIIATHGHFDHILAAFELQQAYRIPFLIHEADTFLVKRMKETAYYFLKIEVPDLPPQINGKLQAGDTIKIGKKQLNVIHTPGHTPGSTCLCCKEDRFMLTGDTIFAEGAVGRTDFSYSSQKQLMKSVEKILRFPSPTRLLPGHGVGSAVLDEKPHHLFAHKDS